MNIKHLSPSFLLFIVLLPACAGASTTPMASPPPATAPASTYNGIILPTPQGADATGAPPPAWLMVNHEAFPATYATYTTALAHADPAEKMPELPAVTLPANSTVTILIASEVVTQAQVTARPWSADGRIVPLFDPADIELKTQTGRDGTLTTLTLESTLLEGDQLLHLFITFPIAFPFATPISGAGEAHYLWRLVPARFAREHHSAMFAIRRPLAQPALNT